MLIASWWEDNWFTLALWVASIAASIIITHLAHLLTRKHKLPRYAIRSVALIRESKRLFPDLQLHFKGYGEDIDNFTVSRVILWNAGRDTIRKADMVDEEPLRVTVMPGIVILAANILQENNPPNGITCTVKRDKAAVDIGFKFLDHNNGAVLEVLHTGSQADDITVTGQLIGAGKPKRAKLEPLTNVGPGFKTYQRAVRTGRRKPALIFFAGNLIVYLLLIVFMVAYVYRFTDEGIPNSQRSALVVSSIFAASCPVWPLVLNFYNLCMRFPPYGLNKFFDPL